MTNDTPDGETPMLTAVLDRLAGRMKQRKASAREIIEAAAKRIAAGQAVDEAALEGALVEAGLPVDDLGRLATLYEGRAARVKSFQGLAAAEKRQQTAQAKIDAEEKRHAAAVAEFRSRIQAIDAELREATSAVDAARAARNWLLEPDHVPPSLADEYRERRDALTAANIAQGDAERIVRHLRTDIRSESSRIESLVRESDGMIHGTILPSVPIAGRPRPDARTQEKIDEHEKRKKRLEARLVEAEKVAKQAGDAVAAAQAALTAVEDRILKS